MTRRDLTPLEQSDWLLSKVQSIAVAAADAILPRFGHQPTTTSLVGNERSMGRRRRGYVASSLQIPVFVMVLAYCTTSALSMCSNSCSRRGDCNPFGR